MKASPPAAAAPLPERLIRRYENRKLYDPEAARYVTLQDVGRVVAGGAEVRVLDQATGEDLTTVVLAQVVLEGLKQRTARIPRQVLARLVRLGSLPAAGLEAPTPPEAAARAREEAERIVGGLLARGRLTLDEALALRQDISASVHRLVAEAQHGLEARLRGLLDHTEGDVGPALQALRERLLAFETRLAGEPSRPAAPSGRRRRRPAKRPRRSRREEG